MTSPRSNTATALLRGAVRFTLLAAIGLGLTVAGCQSAPKQDATDTAAAPPAPEVASSLRESIQKSHPGSLVGTVIQALTDTPYAAVNDINVNEAKIGQTVTFLDGNGHPFSAGTLVAIVGDSIHIRYDTAGKRPPQRGDLAVIIKD